MVHLFLGITNVKSELKGTEGSVFADPDASVLIDNRFKGIPWISVPCLEPAVVIDLWHQNLDGKDRKVVDFLHAYLLKGSAGFLINVRTAKHVAIVTEAIPRGNRS
jgi:hypothetical protein